MPAFAAVIDSPEWRALPHRAALAEIAHTATPLPKQIRRQFPIETVVGQEAAAAIARSEEHTSELQSLMRISYAVFCLKKNTSTSLTTDPLPTHQDPMTPPRT